MPELALQQRTLNHSPSYESAEGGGLGGLGNIIPDSPDPSKVSISKTQSGYDTQRSGGAYGEGGFSGEAVGKAIVSRFVRAAKRGNLPFMLVFIICLAYFFSALAGMGYVDPETLPAKTASEIANPVKFMPGAPVFAPIGDSDLNRRLRADEMKELEQQWQKKKRPQDGAWMQKGRDTKAFRRVPVKAPEPAKVEQYELSPDTDKEKRDLNEQEQARLFDLGGDDKTFSGEEKVKEPEIEVEKTSEGISVDQAEQEKEALGAEPAELADVK